MFCHITQNWRGKPLESLGGIVDLIGHTTTEKGLKIRAEIDASSYPKGQTVSDEAMKLVQLKPDAFHGEWNYAILPHAKSQDVHVIVARCLSQSAASEIDPRQEDGLQRRGANRGSTAAAWTAPRQFRSAPSNSRTPRSYQYAGHPGAGAFQHH